ncbi:MAG: TetR/AcrR family transcriptional regulator [Thermoleophilaceae bacterium]|nr:TetR/AcrR family transcriptional regulator [Thermoleophilaceae bacterium]
MRKEPKQARSREMVQRIVTAARLLLVNEGYDRFATNRVAAAAGISPGSLYQYFPDKQAILDVVIDQYWEDLATQIELSLSDRIDEFSPANARAVIDALLTALESDPALLRVLLEELPRSRVLVQYRTMQRRIRDLAATLMVLHGQVTDRAAAQVKAWVMVVAIENLAIHWVLDQTEISRDELLDEAVALTAAYLDTAPQG